MATAADYLDQLKGLLPTGPAWSRAPGSVLSKLLTGIAQEFARVDARARQLMEEADPRTSVEMLDDWERVLGLPDDCTAAATTVPARQIACFRKLAALGGQTPAFYVGVAASLGYLVEIHEFDPDVDDYEPGLDISGNKWRMVWRVDVLTSTDFTLFRAGASSAGDRLGSGGSTDLECVIRELRPAHTHVVFSYSGS
ncbi:MAG: hypothetical protein JWP35_3552 [Caulobacter sp.]|nr:hypothetical protein [Caulobacter sp.]